jgi:hypothetical protein
MLGAGRVISHKADERQLDVGLPVDSRHSDLRPLHEPASRECRLALRWRSIHSL